MWSHQRRISSCTLCRAVAPAQYTVGQPWCHLLYRQMPTRFAHPAVFLVRESDRSVPFRKLPPGQLLLSLWIEWEGINMWNTFHFVYSLGIAKEVYVTYVRLKAKKSAILTLWKSPVLSMLLSRVPMLYRQGSIRNHSPRHTDWNYWNQEETFLAWWCSVRDSIKYTMWANGLHIAPLWAVHTGARGCQCGKSVAFSFVEGRIRNGCHCF